MNNEKKCSIDLGEEESYLSQISATIFVTDRCNLACSYCYEENKEFTDIKLEYIDKFLNLLYTDPRYCNRKKIILDFIGGEPLTVPHIIDYAITKFFEIGRILNHHWIKCGNFGLFVTTNGTLFSNPNVKELLEKFPCLKVGLSLDGCKSAHDTNRKYIDGTGSYDKIMENFDWWKNKYNSMNVKGTLSPNTLHLLSEMLIGQIELGMFEIWANPIFEHKWTKEEGDLYESELKKVIDYIFENKLEYLVHNPIFSKILNFKRIDETTGKEENWCGTCKYMISLGLDGELYPCHRFSTSSKPYRYSIGNVDDGTDKDRMDYLVENIDKMNCKDCEFISQCPMCYAGYLEISEGRFENPKNICEMVKAEYRVSKYYASVIQKKEG